MDQIPLCHINPYYYAIFEGIKWDKHPERTAIFWCRPRVSLMKSHIPCRSSGPWGGVQAPWRDLLPVINRTIGGSTENWGSHGSFPYWLEVFSWENHGTSSIDDDRWDKMWGFPLLCLTGGYDISILVGTTLVSLVGKMPTIQGTPPSWSLIDPWKSERCSDIYVY